jgi:hypothetical protein
VRVVAPGPHADSTAIPTTIPTGCRVVLSTIPAGASSCPLFGPGGLIGGAVDRYRRCVICC